MSSVESNLLHVLICHTTFVITKSSECLLALTLSCCLLGDAAMFVQAVAALQEHPQLLFITPGQVHLAGLQLPHRLSASLW